MQCSGITSKRVRCKNKALKNSKFCRIHLETKGVQEASSKLIGHSNTEILEKLEKIDAYIDKENSGYKHVLDIANKVLIPGLLALIAILTYVSNSDDSRRQIELLDKQEERNISKQEFEKTLNLQKLYIEYLTSNDAGKQNAAILILQLMKQSDVIVLANWANHLELTKEQRKQIIQILCDKGSKLGCPYTIVKGTFTGVSDGDSVRFQANTESNWLNIDGWIKKSRTESVMIRLAGVDASEIHYLGCDILERQKGVGIEAQNALRQFIFQSKDAESAVGYLAVNTSDSYGRAIGFLYIEDANFRDGSVLYMKPNVIQMSANYNLINQGYAYPYLQKDLTPTIISEYRFATRKARENKAGIWAINDQVNTQSDLNRKLFISGAAFPKLTRSICRYLGSNESNQGLAEYLKTIDSVVMDMATNNKLPFSKFIHIDGNKVKLTRNPEDLVFQ